MYKPMCKPMYTEAFKPRSDICAASWMFGAVIYALKSNQIYLIKFDQILKGQPKEYPIPTTKGHQTNRLTTR